MDNSKKSNAWVDFLKEQSLKKNTSYALELADIDNRELYRLHKQQNNMSVEKVSNDKPVKTQPVKKQPVKKQSTKEQKSKHSKKQNKREVEPVVMI